MNMLRVCFAVLYLSLSNMPSLTAQNQTMEEAEPFTLYTNLLKPTKPAPIQRLFYEWEPSSALYVSVPAFLASTPDMRRLLYFKDIIKGALPVVPVTIVLNSEEKRYNSFLMEDFLPQYLSETDLERVTFFPTTNNSPWIRDYAPFYALDPDFGVILLDTFYTRNQSEFLMNEMPAPGRKDAAAFFGNSMNAYAINTASWEDTFPSMMAHRLRGESFRPIRLVRPPIFLEGGDYILDGCGALFLSLGTLHQNGGDIEELNEKIRSYFGIERVHYLRELQGQGETIEHLDYVIKFTAPGIALIAEPWKEITDTSYRRSLARETRKVLEFNEGYIRTQLPHIKLIPVPLLPPARDSEEFILNTIRDQLEKDIAFAQGWITEAVRNSDATTPLEEDILNKVEAYLMSSKGLLDLNKPERLEAAAMDYYYLSLEQLRKRHVDRLQYPRSYLNSLHLVNHEGRERFLIPRFKPLDAEEARWMPEVEAMVEKAYKKARPDADIVWIDADIMATGNGTIHCTTHTVPDWTHLPPYIPSSDN